MDVRQCGVGPTLSAPDLRDRHVRHLVSVPRLILDLGVGMYGNSWHMPMARTNG